MGKEDGDGAQGQGSPGALGSRCLWIALCSTIARSNPLQPFVTVLKMGSPCLHLFSTQQYLLALLVRLLRHGYGISENNSPYSHGNDIPVGETQKISKQTNILSYGSMCHNENASRVG